MSKYSLLFGRILVAAIFLLSGMGKIFNFTGTAQYMTGAGMPFASFFLTGAILLEISGGLSLILGYRTQWGAAFLMLFLIPATLIFHNQLSDQTQMIMFMKNLAIFGGLMLLASNGAGDWSLDKKLLARIK